ncbi:MAG: hypothetical protein WDW38_008716 [Sanguina aurantia]
MDEHKAPQVSRRVLDTDAPCIIKTKKMMMSKPGALSLAQGIVHWGPPPEALAHAAHAVMHDPSVHSYGPGDGLPALVQALQEKILTRNGLEKYKVMVTAGANQAFTNVVLALMDETDEVVLFTPYYFNHLMAIQMTGGASRIIYGECDPLTLHPNLEWLQTVLSKPTPPKMVVLVNPCNPTGVLLSKAEVQQASDMCAAAGTWLVLDNTYEDFVFGGREHFCVGGRHVINIFSFSKAYGAMGWRVGYVAYPDYDGDDAAGSQLLKIQDTIPICASTLSQQVALVSLTHGHEYVRANIDGLAGNREVLIDALSPLRDAGCTVAGGEGAIYLWAQLPRETCDDEAVVAWLVQEHGVGVIPGSACGSPGYFRAAFGNLKPDVYKVAAARLKAGLRQLVEHRSLRSSAQNGTTGNSHTATAAECVAMT